MPKTRTTLSMFLREEAQCDETGVTAEIAAILAALTTAALGISRGALAGLPGAPGHENPVILGSKAEVQRLVRCHHEHLGEDRPRGSPTFAPRSVVTS